MSRASNSNDPSGLFIDAPKNKWQIGPCLGSGACGSVHKLVNVKSSSSSSSNSSSNCNYVVKIAPLPKGNSNTKTKKKKKSDVEKNADLLWFENTLYRNVFNNLRHDKMIPDIPIDGSYSSYPPGFGDLESSNSGSGSGNGYRFFVMEQMERPFHDLVPLLLEGSNGNGNGSSNSKDVHVDIGPIANRLIDLIEAIHDTQRLFVDVKPENFMLASSASSSAPSKGKRKTTSKTSKTSKATLGLELANRIRMIDFGLVETIKDATNNKHRIDSYPNGQVVGTPLYASLNVLSGHTVSRRDDLESVGYVISELILQIMDYYNNRAGTSSRNKKHKHTRSGNSKKSIGDVNLDILPWSNCGATSDDEIFTIKKNSMRTENGVLWDMLKGIDIDNTNNDDDDDEDVVEVVANDKVCDIMKEYFDSVMTLEYKQKPDYDYLREITSELTIPISTTSRTSSEMNYHKKQKSTVDASRSSSAIMATKKKKKKAAAAAAATMSTSTSISTTTRRITRSTAANNTIVDIEDDEDDYEDDDDIVIVEQLQSPPSSPPKTHKRKTRTSQKAAAKLEDEEEEFLTNSTGKKSKGKARKKRITKTTIKTTKTVEIFESDDDEEDGDYCDDEEMRVVEQEEERIDNDNDSDNGNDDDLVEFVEANENIDDFNDNVRDSDSDEEMLSAAGDDDGDYDNDNDVSFKSCTSMEWDTVANINNNNNDNDGNVNDENEASTLNQASASAKGSSNGSGTRNSKPLAKSNSLKLECIEGCHKGVVLFLSNELILGQDPGGKKKNTKRQIFQMDDDEASKLHTKLVLNRSGSSKSKKKSLLTVRVTDLKSDNGTFVNGKKVSGSGKQAFVNDKIKIGGCVFCIKHI